MSKHIAEDGFRTVSSDGSCKEGEAVLSRLCDRRWISRPAGGQLSVSQQELCTLWTCVGYKNNKCRLNLTSLHNDIAARPESSASLLEILCLGVREIPPSPPKAGPFIPVGKKFCFLTHTFNEKRVISRSGFRQNPFFTYAPQNRRFVCDYWSVFVGAIIIFSFASVPHCETPSRVRAS